MGISRTFLCILGLLFLFEVRFTKAALECKEVTYPADSYCETVGSWEDLAVLVNETVPGDELYLCPFSINKGDEDPIYIEWGLSIICVKTEVEDACTLRGSGMFIIIETGSDTLLQGFDFQEGNDYAVHVTSTNVERSDVTRTFCYLTFIGFNRLTDVRGGVFMTQSDAGIVNLFDCYFANNYSATRGAAIYTRTNQMNIVGTTFVDNAAMEWGGAIFVSQEANIYLERSTFLRNYGIQDHAVVVKPSPDSGVWTDGGDNVASGAGCAGFYSMFDQICDEFVEEEAFSHADWNETDANETMSDLRSDEIDWNSLVLNETDWNETESNGTESNEFAWNELEWNETDWNETDWNETDWNETDWNETDWNETESNQTSPELELDETDYNELEWNETDWNETDWNETDWNETEWNETLLE